MRTGCEMGNSYAGQLKTTRFEEVLHNSIEASLRSNNLVPRPIFSQLYLEAEQQLSSIEGGVDNDDDDEDDDVSGSSSPTHSYQNKPPPEGCCTTDGFCQAGKDLRLASIASEQFEVPPGFLLVGAKSPSLPDHVLVCAVDKRFLPDDNGRNALLGFSGNCVGCGEKGFRYFTEFSNHINLKLTTQPKKQKHLKYYLIRNAQGYLTKGALISWKGTEVRSRHSSSSLTSTTGLTLLDSSVAMINKMSDPAIHMTNGGPLAGENGFPQVPNGTTYQNNNGTYTQQSAKLNPSVQTRPAVLGNVTNSGPPKKRHKGWSPESPSSTDPSYPQNNYHNASSHGKVDAIGQVCAPQPTPGNPLSSALVASGESVSIPDNLLKTCMITPVIFKGHGNFPYLCGNVNEVIVSPLLFNCYKNSQSMPKTYEQYGHTTIQPISEEMQLLLTVYYLVQLAPDQMPLIEDLEQILMRSWRETHLAEIRQYQQNISQTFPHFPNHVTAVTASQLPWLAGLAASSCNESVKIIECSFSLAEGLSEMCKLLVEGKLSKTNYVVIICTMRPTSIDSCIVITGKYQARALIESMYSPADYLKEINYELTSGKAESLRAFFSSFCPDGDIDVLLDKYHQESHSLISSTPKKTTGETRPAACSSYNIEWHHLRPSQLAVAQKLLSHVCSIADSSTQNLDLGSFEKVDFLICVPPSEVTYQQTLSHVWSSGVLLELGLEKDQLTRQSLEQYVIKIDPDAPRKFKLFLQKAMQNPHTLFVLVHDHAHWDLTSSLYTPHPQKDTSFGLVDRLLNCRELRDAPNILHLHVTSCPYALQTQNTRISPYNEIHWPSSYSHGTELYHENRKYFGLSQYIESTLSGHSLPLLRHDSSFEAIVLALGKRFPKLHSAVIRTFLLVQHYSSAMMAICGLSQMKSYTSVETLEIIQNLLNSPKQCASGHGLMVLLRIPCIQLATLAYERLCHIRERLGLQNRFEVILGTANSAITIGKHFVDQLKVWQKNEEKDWQPRTYLELEGLPCILICSGTEPLGESLPRSLRYCDLRLVQFHTWERTAIEQELGFASCFLDSDGSQDRGLGRDVLDSDPEKLSSTDNEEEEMGMDGSNSEKRSPAKRQRSPSDDSASSSLSSKASGSVSSSESSYTAMVDDTTKPTQQLKVSNSDDCATEKLKSPSDNNTKKPSAVTCEQPDSNTHSTKNNSSSASTPSSTSSSCFHSGAGLQISQCAMAKAYKQPPVVFLPKLVYDIITSTDSSGLSKSSSFLPHCDVSWASSFRPLLSKMMTCTEQSLYYRQWTTPKASHMDYCNINEGRMDTFHPRRLLLSGPPQVGKSGAYLQFLSVLSRMLIRLTEVDVYDEEEKNISLKSHPDPPLHQTQDMWPNVDLVKKMDFDYVLHDPKYEDASVICPEFQNFNKEDKPTHRRHEDIYVRRPTTRMRLSKYASYNTYHHCEQCHQYMGYNPRFQMYESTLHAFAFSYSMLGEEIQLHFIIPKSKEHHFVFSQPGGQLESMRLPLITDKGTDNVKSPMFTPTTGRHEHGLFNLYHAMDGSSHLHILVVKEYEMAIYKKYWPNHIMLVLPSIFNNAGVGAAHFLIKELSYHNLELERNRQAELGVPHQDVWPFIVIADDSCVMWNTVDVKVTEDPRDFSWHERNVSLKHVLQHMEATQNVVQYAMLGTRKWTSKTKGVDVTDPFSRCHLHDFVLLNVDLTRDVQYNQNRFTCHDIDFNLRVNSSGLLICRFNRFSLMKKQIAVGGHRSLQIKPKVLDLSLSVSSAHYICAPDSKHTILAAPAQLLLEKFLQFHSHRFFPLSVNNHSHPVLVVDCYLNLGPQISVCCVSSRPHSVNISCPDMTFSGLLLHLCDSFVVASFLKKFQFLKDATLCVVCQDRNALRQTVVRLELEDEWQFRLRDEFQTANAKEDKPLFILTGRHV
ncbi:protein GREB1 isoform X2 [Hyla sarda]|uniref:protein GREB1 isoform X2 n=1 Tax=Hyla sarda TaxID=327740 RepID=UPI0024C395BE|nr:protein GREB1 isoform X2 [Hyla sarda]